MKLIKEFGIGISIITLGIFMSSYVNKTSTINPPKFATGQKVANIKMNNPEGKEINLDIVSDHKLILIDFWASWCGPCRGESPHLVAAYNKYKDTKFVNAKKGFDIFSVSFDVNKANWKKAIEQDGLVWENHVSELKGWRSEYGAIYGVGSIPYNLLIDDTGTVLAQNLRGGNIEATLKKYLK